MCVCSVANVWLWLCVVQHLESDGPQLVLASGFALDGHYERAVGTNMFVQLQGVDPSEEYITGDKVIVFGGPEPMSRLPLPQQDD